MERAEQEEGHTLERDHLIKDFLKVVLRLTYLLLLTELMQPLIPVRKVLRLLDSTVLGGNPLSVQVAVQQQEQLVEQQEQQVED